MVRTARARARRDAAADPGDRLRHGRHLDRRLALRRRVRARVRDAGRRRAHARADDEHPHRRGRRRLDPRASTARAFASGPQSAGANPGPACYRRGGPLTVTDANVMVGKIQPALLPAACSARAATSRSTATSSRRASPRSRPRSSARPARRARRRRSPRASSTSPSAAMANAIKKISVARGYDVTRYTLQCFGGAGGQHACRVADALGMNARVRASAGRRAVGLRHGPRRPERDARGGDRAAARRRAAQRRRERARRRSPRDAEASSSARASRASACAVHRRVHVRYEGTDSALVVPFGDAAGDPRRVRGRLPAALRVPDAASAR